MTRLYSHPHFRKHDVPPDHPERPERLERIEAELRELPGECMRTTSHRSARHDELARVHTPGYLETLSGLRGKDASLDHETHVSPGSVDAALLAAGTCLDMVEALATGTLQAGFALVRPPGHHALPDRGMGYCLLNNVAIAAAHARSKGLERVLVLDWDVHHGNGTQAAFYDDPHVLVIDLHQERLFPAGGEMAEAGAGRGAGYTVNVPLPSGSTNGDYVRVLLDIVAPVARWYRPGLLLVSAGFDAAAGDPEGGMDLTSDGFFDMASVAAGIAARHAGGRIGLVLEGGYGLATLGTCVRRTVEALVAAPPVGARAASVAAAAATPPVERVITDVRRRVRASLPVDFAGPVAP